MILAWVVVAAGLFILSSSAGRDTSNNLTLNGTGSQEATDLLENRWPEEANGSNPVAIGAPKGKKVTDPQYIQPIQEVVQRFQKDPAVESVESPLAGTPQSERLISKDQRVAVISITIKAVSYTHLTLPTKA